MLANNPTQNPIQPLLNGNTLEELSKEAAYYKTECLDISFGNITFKGELSGILDRLTSDDYERECYYYHTDHLGSSSYISDAQGDAIQHLLYLPYGESFINQKLSSYSSRYTFSGKEKDTETDYGYFGARYYKSDISIWLSVDPLADKYPSLSPYMYCAGNPVVLVDPDGRSTDWYMDNETGEIKWIARKGEQGTTEKIRGKNWTNLGSELLKFEGNKLTYFWQTQDNEGKLKLNSESYNAVSGKPIESESNLTFDYSKKSQNTKGGALPEGLYYIQKSEIQQYENTTAMDKIAGIFGRGTFRGGTKSWGENRWWLKPITAYAENRDMNSFTIHGGETWGSHGCIDLTHNLSTFTSTFLHVANNKNVVLWVDYSKKSSFTIQKEQWGW